MPENPHCLIAQGSKEPVAFEPASQIGSASGFTMKLRDGGGFARMVIGVRHVIQTLQQT